MRRYAKLLDSHHTTRQSKNAVADVYLIWSSLEYILNANIDNSIRLRLRGKSFNEKALPPLAVHTMNRNECGGIGDIFYSAAIQTQTYASLLNQSDVDSSEQIKDMRSSMVSLLADSGLYIAAEKHIVSFLEEYTNSFEGYFRSVMMTPGVYESEAHIQEIRKELEQRNNYLTQKIESYRESETGSNTNLVQLNEFVFAPTFYFVYQGYNDKDLLSQLHYNYASAYPSIAAKEIPIERSLIPVTMAKERKKIGFVSKFFRRHSICKLFCGIVTGLNSTLFDTYAFSSLEQHEEDEHTNKLHESLGQNFVRVAGTFSKTRYEVYSREIDILIYLDVGMDPATSVWASSRLAPVQICTWGHPTTTGMESMDYFISSFNYHDQSDTYESYTKEAAYTRFNEQLVLFDSLGFLFEQPLLSLLDDNEQVNMDDLRLDLSILKDQSKSTWLTTKLNTGLLPFINHYNLVLRTMSFYRKLQSTSEILYQEKMSKLKRTNKYEAQTLFENYRLSDIISMKIEKNIKVVLCPQFLPKFHPHFDKIIMGILIENIDAIVVIVEGKKSQWKKALLVRWKQYLQSIESGFLNSSNTNYSKDILSRIVWSKSLSASEYLVLLSLGDVMIDPFPFGGGVTTLESLAVCTPVITQPGKF